MRKRKEQIEQEKLPIFSINKQWAWIMQKQTRTAEQTPPGKVQKQTRTVEQTPTGKVQKQTRTAEQTPPGNTPPFTAHRPSTPVRRALPVARPPIHKPVRIFPRHRERPCRQAHIRVAIHKLEP